MPEVTTPNLETIERCVENLRAGRQATRMAAERQLLAWGTPIIPALNEIAADDLDTEQKHRLRLVLLRLRPAVDDNPRALARLLVNDRTYWSGIADRMRDDQLKFVSDHLTRLGSDPLPTAAESPQHRVAASRPAE